MQAGSIVELVHLASLIGVDTWPAPLNEPPPACNLNTQPEPEAEHNSP
jgi:hypothetical protein